MAAVTATDISTLLGDSAMASLFNQNWIDAVEQERIIDVISFDAYEHFEENKLTTTAAEWGLITVALNNYCAGLGLRLLSARPAERGVFNLNAEHARRTESGEMTALKQHYFDIANGSMKQLIALIEEGKEFTAAYRPNDYDPVSYKHNRKEYQI
jgi:hypothetical protein